MPELERKESDMDYRSIEIWTNGNGAVERLIDLFIDSLKSRLSGDIDSLVKYQVMGPIKS